MSGDPASLPTLGPRADSPPDSVIRGRPVRAAAVAAETSPRAEPLADEPPFAEEDEAPGAATAGSLLPVVISALAGLLVVGLLAVIMLSPRGGATPAQAQTLVLTPAAGSLAGTAAQEMPRPGYLAPDFTLNRLDGTQVKLSSFRGVKPVWVNFWATWCPPCRGEMPEMQKIYGEYRDKGLEILGVDVQEDAAKVQDFIGTNGYGWNFLLDRDGNVSRNYYVSGIPTHVFIGRDGVVKNLLVQGLNHDLMVAELTKILTP